MPPEIARRLEESRARVAGLSGTKFAGGLCSAFDRYVLRGNTYAGLFPLKEDICRGLQDGVFGADWFFVSGGYGIVHALEAIQTYDATFLRGQGAPFVGDVWRDTLPAVLNAVLERLEPSEVLGYFRDDEYRAFCRDTGWYRQNKSRFDLERPLDELPDRCRRLLENP